MELEINAKASEGGYVRVEVLGEDHQPIAGYSHQDCTPLTTDAIRHTVTWGKHKDLQAVGPRRGYFMFRLKDSEIFSFSLKHPRDSS